MFDEKLDDHRIHGPDAAPEDNPEPDALRDAASRAGRATRPRIPNVRMSRARRAERPAARTLSASCNRPQPRIGGPSRLRPADVAYGSDRLRTAGTRNFSGLRRQDGVGRRSVWFVAARCAGAARTLMSFARANDGPRSPRSRSSFAACAARNWFALSPEENIADTMPARARQQGQRRGPK